MRKIFSLGKELAKLFLESGQDVVIFIAEVGGREVKVTLNFVPVREVSKR